jgi:hypothetical protein
MNIVYIGDRDVIIEQSIGVIRDIAIRKHICVRKKPSTEAAKIFGKSLLSTLCFGKKSDISQNNAPAPNERMVNSAIGDMAPLLVKSLHTTMLSPNIVYAVKQARCPKIEFVRSITTN